MLVQSWNADQNEDHNTARDLHMKLLGIWNAISGQGMVANVQDCDAASGTPGRRSEGSMACHRGRGKAYNQKALADAGVIS